MSRRYEANEHRLRKIRLLRHARQQLANRQSEFICIALDNAAGDDRNLKRASRELQSYINRELGGSSITLSSWLGLERPDLPQTNQDRRLYRIQWIEWMIHSLENP